MLEKVQNQLVSFGILAGLFLIAAAGLILFTDPAKDGALTIGALYLSIFFFSWNFFALIVYLLRKRITRGLHHQKMSVALRQGFLIAIFIAGSLLLSSKGLLHWWIELTFLITLALLEGFFLF